MWRLLCCVMALGGCWSAEPLIDDAFTPEQWAKLQADFGPPAGIEWPPNRCNLPNYDLRSDPMRCALAAQLGQELFWEPALSGGPLAMSCVTCHDAKAWFIDTRTPNNVSLNSSNTFTKHNSMSLVNVALKDVLAPSNDDENDRHEVFTWDGGSKNPPGVYRTPGSVLQLALFGPMASSNHKVANVIACDSRYASEFAALFPSVPPTRCCSPMEIDCLAAADEPELVHKLQLPFDAYLRRLVSLDAPFDRYIAGDETAISDSAKRGFAVFVGRGTCAECHRGPALSDFRFHNTGVPQAGAHVPATDLGRADLTPLEQFTVDETGKFLTPSLRQVAATGPYMHDGVFERLADVISFYRHGGVADGYSGTRDPRIAPIELTDDDARDLESFLGTLTGLEIDASLQVDTRSCSGTTETRCDGTCVDLSNDPAHCGSCDTACMTGVACVAGTCQGPQSCGPPLMSCNGVCIPTDVDPMNCGACGHACPSYMPICMMGTCAP